MRSILTLAIVATMVVPAAAVTPPPPGPIMAGAPVCPLWQHPGEPAALYPHPQPAAYEAGGRLEEPSGWAALAAARGWVEVGRPDRALEALAAAPSGPAERLYRLAALDALRRWPELDAALADTPAGALPAGCGPLHDLWTARAALAAGRGGEADRALERLAAALPALGTWVEVLRLEASAAGGDIARGEAAWARLQRSGLPEMARSDARRLLPELYERGGRLDAAITWHVTLAGETRGEARARHLLDGARLADRRGDASRANELRLRALVQEPAHAAELVLDPGQRERLRLEPLQAARLLVEGGRAAEAEPFLAAVLESGARPEVIREATLLRARARSAGGDRAGSERDYAAYLSRWPTDPHAADAAFERARLALDARDGPVARHRLEEFLSRWRSHARADDAMYLIGDSWHDEWKDDARDAERAIAAFDRLVATRRGSYFGDRAEMRAAHLAYALGRYGEAERRYRAYRGEGAREARYWTARALDARGRRDEARAIWRDLAAGGDEYYALLSRDRLRGGPGLASLLPAGYAPPPDRGFVSRGDILLETSTGRTAEALLALGRRRWAHAELDRGMAGVDDRSILLAWAAALEAWGFPDLAMRIGLGLGAGEGAQRLTYPTGFAPALDREAREHGLDGRWVTALIRQESMFRSTAVSPVGARGLMQIMPYTGREIADSQGWPAFEADVLFDPAVSLHFGSVYLADQRDRFGGFWPAVLAAYNGGPHNVAVWIEFPERQIDAELWVDRIPYRETRNYVKKIVAQWATYRRLYGDSGPAL
jgi:soluble lytic murein transglycosylase